MIVDDDDNDDYDYAGLNYAAITQRNAYTAHSCFQKSTYKGRERHELLKVFSENIGIKVRTEGCISANILDTRAIEGRTGTSEPIPSNYGTEACPDTSSCVPSYMWY